MVCTLLAGVNVVAFAADGDQELTVSVSKFYNDAKKGGDGEHLFTKDAEEMSWLSSLPTWNNEGVAWKAPVVSTEAIYRCYNSNSGEHFYVDEEEAEWLVSLGWTKEKVAFYSDDDMGVPVYRLWNGQDGVGSHHFTIDEGEVSWLLGQGWSSEGIAFYGVADASNVVSLVDPKGLQADGTALLGDTLQVVFGSTFGVPSQVAWYKDGAAVKVIKSDIKEDALTLDTADYGEGTYYVQVENSAGKIFKTNTITVAEEAEAVMTDFTISDPYETGTVDLRADSSLSVVDVTLNRNYDGKFYLVNSEFDEYDDITGDAFEPEEYDKDAHTGNTVTVDKASKFTNAKLKECYLTAFAAGDNVVAIRYIDSDNKVHYKMFTKIEESQNAVTRADEYYLIFDQNDDVDDNTTRIDWNTTDDFAVPYVLAPTSIKVTDAQGTVDTAGWSAQLYFGDNTADYLNAVNMGMPINYNEDELQMNLFKSANTDFKTKTAFADGGTDLDITDGDAGNMYKGKAYSAIDWTATPVDTTDSVAKAAAGTETWVFATFTAEAGIFGEDELKLASEAQSVLPMVGTATLAESTKDAKDINVTLNNLKGSSTIALVTSGVKGTITNPVDDMSGVQNKALLKNVEDGNILAMARASKGQSSVTFDDVLSKINDTEHGDLYAVVIIPDNDEDYAKGMGFGVMTQVQSDYELDEVEYVAGSTTLTCLDQFGNEMKDIAAISERNMNGITEGTPAATKFAMADDTGIITLTAAGVDAPANDTVGDLWSVALTKDKTFYAEVTHVTDNVADAWTVWVE